jgi:hypothetical protein
MGPVDGNVLVDNRRLINLEVYTQLRDAVVTLLEKYPPQTHYFIGLGRDPAPITAMMQNIGGIDLAVNVPGTSGKSWHDKVEPDVFARYFEHFIPKEVLEGQRTIVLVDQTETGGTLGAMGPQFERYFADKGVRVEVRRAAVADPGTAFYQRKMGNDHISTERFPAVAQFLWPPYEDSLSEHDRSQMNETPDPRQITARDAYAQVRKGIAERMEGDQRLDEFLATLGPVPSVGATPPGQQQHDAERIAASYGDQANAPTRSDRRSHAHAQAEGKDDKPPTAQPEHTPQAAPAPNGQPPKDPNRVTEPPPGSRAAAWRLTVPPRSAAPASAVTLSYQNKQAQVLDATQYRDLSAGTLQLLGQFPPDPTTSYLGVGRSSSAVHAFMEQLGISSHYLPADGLKKDLEEGTTGPQLEQAFHQYFARMLPKAALEAKTIVLHQRSDTGQTLPLVKQYLETYLRNQGSRAKVESVAFSSSGQRPANVHVIDTRNLPGLEELGGSLVKHYSVQPFHRIGTDKDLEQLRPQSVFQQFSSHLKQHMGADPQLQSYLGQPAER